jgi:signal peptidase II
LKQSNNKTAASSERRKPLQRLSLITLISVLVVDQVSKIWVKTQMYLDESIAVFGQWFFIHFIENPGMAFGMELGGEWGKLLLSIFRLVAIGFIAYYLRGQIRTGAHKGLIFSVSLVLAGAVGNMIDSAFYGMIFSESPRFTPTVAVLFPPEGGYAGFLQGKVVDMLYFPIIDTHFPDWMPWIGGERFQFFRPVFNVADSAITVGMALILINQKRYFADQKEPGYTVEASGNESEREHDGHQL